jgi:tetratricopeptide (TPR) repeat protein
LIVVTCWQKEWQDQADPAPIAATIKRYDGEETIWWRTVEVGPVIGEDGDLGPMLRSALSGLTAPQADALLDRAAGNPRFLGEIMQYLVDHPRYFVDRDTNAALTSEGLVEALNKTLTLHDLIKDRLKNRTPTHVQRAVCLGSLQGINFLAGLTSEVARRLHDDLGDGVALAERPHGFVAFVNESVVEFVQRIYYEVASDHLPDIVEPNEARTALADAVRARLEDESRLASLPATERIYTWAFAASLFQTAADPNSLRVAYRGLSELVAAAGSAFDYSTALGWARRFALVTDTQLSLPAILYWQPIVTLARGERAADLAAAGNLANRMLAAARVEPQTNDNVRLVMAASTFLAGAARARGDLDEAEKLYRESLGIRRRLAEALKTPEAERDVSVSLDNVAGAARARGDLDEAEKLYRESLGIRRRLAEALKTPEAERDVSVSHAMLAMIAEARGQGKEACAEWQAAHASAIRLLRLTNTPEARQMAAETAKNVERVCT